MKYCYIKACCIERRLICQSEIKTLRDIKMEIKVVFTYYYD